ncbi:MAG: PilZ domain-containing protein [candidate division NC10 bacterium]|nr:PilZ domain-containing protein [candidate division NC10 bacterium]
MTEGMNPSQPRESLGRRRFLRLPVSLPLVGQVAQRSGGQIRGTVRNVCSGGMMVELPVEVEPGNAMRSVLHTKQGPMQVEGRVVWTAPSGNRILHGVAFPEPKGHLFAMDLFLRENRSRPA